MKSNLKDYFSDFNLELFEKRLDFTLLKLKNLKTEKARGIYYIEIYSSFIQLIEIFCINSIAISDNNLFDNLFLSNKKMTQKIESRFFHERSNSNQKYIDFILNTYVFNGYKGTEQQKNIYKQLLKEGVQDYLKDKNFLNSYKHGFRVKSSAGRKVYISTNNKDFHGITSLNSTVHYLTKENNIIYENTIGFNWERIYTKCAIMINVLDAMKQIVITTPGKEIQFSRITFPKPEKVYSKFGNYRWKIPTSYENF